MQVTSHCIRLSIMARKKDMDSMDATPRDEPFCGPISHETATRPPHHREDHDRRASKVLDGS